METYFYLVEMSLSLKKCVEQPAFTAVKAIVVLSLCLMGSGVVWGQVTVNSDFKGTSESGWVFGGSGGSTTPYLTANTVDTVGDGWLRLTENTGNQATYALFDSEIFSVNAQIEIEMEYAFWNGSGADGITFFLVDGNVDSGSFDPGSYGGSMGYAQRTGEDGMAGGYLGIALDNYGNYSNANEGRNGGTGFIPNAIAVRGPESSGYEFIAGSGNLANLTGGGQMDFPSATTRPNQSGADYRSFKMTLDANNQLTVEMKFGASGNYITAFSADLSSYDRPDTFKIGFTGATGGLNEIHEIRNLSVDMTPWQPDAFEWDDGGGDGNWTTANNWVDNAVPSPSADILFGDAPLTGATQNVTMDGDKTVRSLTFDSDLNYNINGTDTLTMGDPLQVGLPSINVNDYNGAQAQHHINVDIDVVEELRINNYSFSTLCINGSMDTNGNEIDVNGTGATNFNGDIIGSGDLNKNGTGVTTINNDNSDGSAWTGDVTINNGMVVVTTDGALGSTSGTTTVNDGGTLTFRAATTTSNVDYSTTESVTISGNGVFYGNEGSAGAIFNDGGNNNFDGTVTLAADAGIGSRDGVLTFNSSIEETGGQQSLTKLGNGVVVLNDISNYTGDTIIEGGVLRITGSSSNNLSGGFVTNNTSDNVGVLRFDGGVLEIGINSDFRREVGTGEEDVAWIGDGGFSAYGGDRSVRLNNGSGTVTWDSGSFVPDGNALLLSSNYSDSKIEFENNINFGGDQREIRVANGSAIVDGEISGDLSNGGLVKTGEGTLNLTGSNNYSGATEIQGGALRGSISSNSNLVFNGGVRELTVNFTGNLGTSGGQVRWAGDGGFSASGSDRTVKLNNSTSAVTWGSTSNFIGAGDTLILGSQSADRTLIFDSAINLGGADRTIRIVDGSDSRDAQMNRVLSNGSLTVVGDGNLALRGNNTMAGTVTVKGATVTLESGGQLNSISGLTVQEGGRLQIDNTVSYDSTRVKDTAPITLDGGTLGFGGRTSNGHSYETVGAITLSGGGNTIDVVNNRSGKRTRLTSASLSRAGQATVNFTNSVTTNGTFSNTGNNPRMRFTSAPTTDDGILAYATVNGTSFAGITSSHIKATSSSTTSQSGWTSTLNAGPSSDQTLTANRSLNSLVLNSGRDVDLDGNSLNIYSGGLLSYGASESTISDGTLTAGGTGDGELIAHVYGDGGLDISAIIVDNGANEVSLTKTGDGTLTLSGSAANTFTGDVTVNDGTLALAKDANVAAITGDISVGDGRGTDILQLNNDEQIADMVNVTLSGSEYGGETILQFNGAGDSGLTETFGDLTIDGVAVIDFAGGNPCDANYLYLDDLLMSSPDSTLFIRNWIDFTDFLLVRNTADIDAVLSQIVFEGYGTSAFWQTFDSEYNVIRPVPEPSTYGAIFMASGFALWFWRRRRQASRAEAKR